MSIGRFRRCAAVALAALLVPVSSLPVAAAQIPAPFITLQGELMRMTAHAPGNIGVEIEDLTTGLSTGINPSANMPAASTIKIPVMVEVFRQMALGAFDLNRTVTLEASDRDWGWGDLADAPGGSRYSVAHLLKLMITQSDNTATNMLIRLVGRVHINRTMASLGLHNTRLGDYIRSDGDIRGLRTSPLDMTRLLAAMAHDRLIDPWSSREMIAILAGQQHNGLVPEPLPPGMTIAHKTGTLHDTLNDVGIVYLNDAPYIISVLTTHLVTLDAGRQFIRGVSRVAYNALERFATWRATNDVPAFSSGIGEPGTPLPAQATPAPEAPDVRMWAPASPEPAQETAPAQDVVPTT